MSSLVVIFLYKVLHQSKDQSHCYLTINKNYVLETSLCFKSALPWAHISSHNNVMVGDVQQYHNYIIILPDPITNDVRFPFIIKLFSPLQL